MTRTLQACSAVAAFGEGSQRARQTPGGIVKAKPSELRSQGGGAGGRVSLAIRWEPPPPPPPPQVKHENDGWHVIFRIFIAFYGQMLKLSL